MEMHVIESGGGIAAAAQGLDLTIKGSWLQATAALEHHVFQEMRHAVLIALFGSASGSAPQVDTGQ